LPALPLLENVARQRLEPIFGRRVPPPARRGSGNAQPLYGMSPLAKLANSDLFVLSLTLIVGLTFNVAEPAPK
jgi:hypothetical protein